MDRTFSRPDKYHMKEIKMEKSNETADKAVKKSRNKPGGQGPQEKTDKKDS